MRVPTQPLQPGIYVGGALFRCHLGLGGWRRRAQLKDLEPLGDVLLQRETALNGELGIAGLECGV